MKVVLIILAIFIGIIGLILLLLVIGAYNRRPKFNKKGFTALETELLSELFSLFESDIKSKLKAQVDYFEPNRKWRQYWEKSMSMELYGDKENRLSDKYRYNRKDSSKLATIRFKVKDKKYSIEFNTYDGRLWGWKIRPHPKSIMKQTVYEITSKKINTDPNSFAQPLIDKQKFKTIPAFEGWLAQLIDMDEIKDSFHPIEIELLDKYTEQINSKLPDGYLEVIKQTEGIDSEHYRVLGVSEIYSTGLDDGNYFHLVEFDDGIIAVKEGELTGRMYYCHYSGLIDELSTDFGKELIEKIKISSPQRGE